MPLLRGPAGAGLCRITSAPRHRVQGGATNAAQYLKEQTCRALRVEVLVAIMTDKHFFDLWQCDRNSLQVGLKATDSATIKASGTWIPRSLVSLQKQPTNKIHSCPRSMNHNASGYLWIGRDRFSWSLAGVCPCAKLTRKSRFTVALDGPRTTAALSTRRGARACSRRHLAQATSHGPSRGSSARVTETRCK